MINLYWLRIETIKRKKKITKKIRKRPLTYANEYKHLRNRVTSLVRNAKANYFKDKYNSSSVDSKKTYNFIIKIKRPKTIYYRDHFSYISKNNYQVIEIDLIRDLYDDVNKFNSYFTKIGFVYILWVCEIQTFFHFKL